MKKYLLPIILLAFWSCEEDEKVPEATPEGTWNLVSLCEYEFGECDVHCTEVELEAYCSMEDDNSSTAPDNEEDCNNLNGYWIAELTSILTINDDMTGTLEVSARYGSDEDEFYNLTLVVNPSGGYLVNIENITDDSTIDIILTLSNNGESLSIQIIADLGQDDCSLWTFTKQ
ncbi:MAG: hypothetical protein HN920_08250 [Candidatus Marinimicrobia bacterium]|nr:hypothetical protein [Candidatus Neomarinimicrobiota bacterium]